MGCVSSKAESITTSSSNMTSTKTIIWTSIVGFFTRTSFIQVEFNAEDYHRNKAHQQRRHEREAKRRQMLLHLARYDASDENLIEKRCQSWVESLHEAGIVNEAARAAARSEKARLEYLDYLEDWC